MEVEKIITIVAIIAMLPYAIKVVKENMRITLREVQTNGIVD